MIGLIPDQNLVVAQDRVQWDTHDFIMHDAHEKRTQYMWQHVWEWIALAGPPVTGTGSRKRPADVHGFSIWHWVYLSLVPDVTTV